MILLYSLGFSRSLRQASAVFAPAGHFCVGSWMLRDWLADWVDCCSFFSAVYFPSYFDLCQSQSLLALPAVGSALVFACCWLCSSRFYSSFLPFSTLSAALRTHRRFDVLLAVLVPVLLLYLLFTTGSSAVVLSRIPTTCSLAVALSP